MTKKAGPWYDPEPESALKKIALQSGIVTPSQVGLELEKKKGNEKTALEMKQPPLMQTPTKLAKDSPESLPGTPGQGRPKNSKDSQKRKTKVFKPQTGAKLLFWANDAQEKINAAMNPVLLDFYNKKNLRSLSNDENKELDLIKTKILFSLKPFDNLTQEEIINAFHSIDNDNTQQLVSSYQTWIQDLKMALNKDLTVDDYKQAKASFYSTVYSDSITE
jgi:hypothetical protein